MANDIHGIKKSKILALIVSGGIGRNIMATAVVRALKKAYPKKELHVIASCPDVFLKNPNIKKVHRLGNHQYFFSDYVLERNTCVLDVEPYRQRNYVYKERHFIDVWCDLLGIKSDGHKPEIFLSKSEEIMAKDWITQQGKPMVLIQHQGGKNPNDKSEKENIIAASEMHRRSLPVKTVEEIAKFFTEKGFIVGAVQHENQRQIADTKLIQFPIRAVIALIPHVEYIIGIDSFLQHAAACFNKTAIVFWGGTSCKVLGYSTHLNLSHCVCKTPACHRPNSYLFDIETNGFQFECDENDACMNWNYSEILESLKSSIPEVFDGAGNTKDNSGQNEACDKKGSIEETSGGSGKNCPTSFGSACPSARN